MLSTRLLKFSYWHTISVMDWASVSIHVAILFLQICFLIFLGASLLRGIESDSNGTCGSTTASRACAGRPSHDPN